MASEMFPGIKEFTRSAEKDIRQAYANTLTEARKYYEACEELRIEPKEGLQKVVYDLGKRVRGPGRKNRIKTIKLMGGIEDMNRFFRRLNIK